MQRFSRTEMLLGAENMEILKNSHVAVFGLGGVGGQAAEALARSGIGKLTLIDNDTVSLSNLNRQIIATEETIGMMKTEAMKKRILSINPSADLTLHNTFYLPENADKIPLTDFDYVVDAIDTVSAKIELAVRAEKTGVRLISSMGTGNKLDPSKLTVTDIYKTSMCPLARVMRRELKARGVQALKVVYSTEKALAPISVSGGETSKRQIPGSTAFVPTTAGLIIAGVVVRDILGIE